MDRRNFLKTVGAAGLGAGLSVGKAAAESNKPVVEQKTKLPQVSRKVLGKTGVEVPILAHGLMYNVVDNQIILHKALEWGMTYWDTSHSYAGGNSELGIGKFLKNNPDVRKNLFIVTKASRARNIDQVEDRLQTSLKRMNTNYIDLYYGIHGCSRPQEQLTDELKNWAEGAKKRGLIKYFGFSTHKNMANVLLAASKLDWIDVVMTSYNFRLMQDPKMLEAIEACHKAGVGLVAMKVIGHKIKDQNEEDKKVYQHFLAKGYTKGQAAIKVVLEDKRFTSACVSMESVALLTSNVAAVLDKAELAVEDKKILADYARATCSGYCAGCADICEAAVPYVSDVMRSLMYYNSYGDKDMAKRTFAQIPGSVRNKLLSIDYSTAERRCPQRLAITKLMAEAVQKLA